MELQNRLLAVCALGALLSTSVFAQQKPELLTYSSYAKTADLIIEEIAAQTGRKLEVTDDARLHVLIVNVTDAPIDEVLDRIAKVTSSSWRTVQDVRRLQPDTLLRRRELAAQIVARAAKVRAGLEKLRKLLEENPNDSSTSGFGFMDSIGSPADRALARLALMLDPEEVARLATSDRIVFATTPNRMQRSMRGAKTDRILATLFVEHNAYVDKRNKERSDVRFGSEGMDEEMMAYMEMMGEAEPKRFESAPSKAVLIVESGGGMLFLGEGTRVELIVYDQAGNAIVQSEQSLVSNSLFASMAVDLMDDETDEEKREQVAPDPSDIIKIELSEESTIMSKLMLEGPDATEAMSIEARMIFLDPVGRDPLSFGHSDALASIAKAKKLNVVANLPDGSMMDSMMGGGYGPGMTVGTAYSKLTSSDSLAVTNEDGWLVVMPSEPVDSRTLRQDRVVLRALVRKADRDGTVDLDTLAAFALRSPDPTSNGTTMLYVAFFAPTLLQGMMGDTMDWDMLRFYGSLPSSTKRSLKAGDRVPFRSITGKSRTHLQKMAFGSQANIQSAEALQASMSEPAFMSIMRMVMPGQKKDYLEEPTEVMPSGLPSDGFVQLQMSNIPIAKPDKGMGPMMFGMGSLGPDEVAMLEFFSESMGGMMGDMTQEIGRLRLGERSNLRFTFWLSPEAGLSKTLQDDRVAKDAPFVSLNNLPPAFRALVAKAKEQIKNSPMAKMWSMFGDMGGETVDPPQ